MRSVLSRGGILIIALLPRLVLAFITFGTTDLANSFRNTTWLLGGLDAQIPYFPGIEIWLYTGGMLAFHTALPAAFAYKLLTVICDGLIALVLRNAVSPAAGLLYAINPVSIMIASMHGQWDPITLLFLLSALVMSRDEREMAQVSAGAMLVVSAIFKPITLPLFPLFIAPRGKVNPAPFVTGVLATATVYCGALFAIGRPLTLGRLSDVLLYSGSGQRVFGFPFPPSGAYGRFVDLLPAVAIIVLYWLGKLRREDAVLLFFAVTLGISSLAAQYLCWVIPFAILGRRYRFTALYTLAAGLFLVYYYETPLLEVANLVALGAYGMLRPLGLLTPPLPPPVPPALVWIIGSLVIPAILLGFAVWLLIRGRRKPAIESTEAKAARTAWIAPLAALAAAIVPAIWAVLLPAPEPAAFVSRMQTKIAAYDVVQYSGRLVVQSKALVWLPGSFVRGEHHSALFNLGTLLLLWTIAAAAATYSFARKAKGPRAAREGLS